MSPLYRHPQPVGLFTIAACCLVFGCRGQASAEPPVRVVRGMVRQPRATTYSLAAHAAMRPEGSPAVIAQEEAAFAEPLHTGLEGTALLESMPLPITSKLLKRGQREFQIFCSPCHDSSGQGRGTIAQAGFPSPVDLASPNTRQLSDGQLFQVISQGIRNMPALSAQVEPMDRWSIVAWVRVLQRSRNATVADLTPDVARRLTMEKPKP
ncbi:MAG TPA: cytochrome c [Polyangiaceae bacterium]